MAPRYCLLILLLHFLTPAAPLGAQLRLEVYGLPAYTPAEDTLFLAGSLNDWSPADDRFRLERQADGTYTYDFLTPVPDFEFKFTRGDWDRVEGGPFGGPLDNRRYIHRGLARDTIRLRIQSWEDMVDRIAFLDTLTLVVDRVPENTPEGAVLYVTGSFNDWAPRDLDYRMRRRADSSFVVTIPLRGVRTDFKITRGSWASVESRENGMAMPNRTYRWVAGSRAERLHVRVANWEDLAGSPLGWYGILLLLFALQLIVLTVVLGSLRYGVVWLPLLLGVLAIGMVARVGSFDRTIFQALPKLILFPDLLFFLPAPLAYLYLRATAEEESSDNYRVWPHLLTAVVALLVYLPLLLLDGESFTTRVVVGELRSFFWGAAGIGVVVAVGYWVAAGRLTLDAFGRSLRYALLPVLLLWISTVLVGLAYRSGWLGSPDLAEGLADTAWLALGVIPLVVGYWLIRQPDRFRRGRPTEMPISVTLPPASSPRTTREPVAASLLAAPLSITTTTVDPLAELMREQQPYLNPKLTLAELADLAEVPAHQLSRQLNEQSGQSFFDYVNGYRVDHFTEQLRAGAHAERTMLSLALEAGFNSKSAFNRAFKKKMGQTPRQYLRELAE